MYLKVWKGQINNINHFKVRELWERRVDKRDLSILVPLNYHKEVFASHCIIARKYTQSLIKEPCTCSVSHIISLFQNTFQNGRYSFANTI